MNRKISTISAIALASILLVSGFNLSSVEAATTPSVKKIKIYGQEASEPYYHSTPRIVAHTYIFEACAGDKPIRSPEVVVTSDSEVRSVKLASDLSSNACIISSTIIRASDSGTIDAKLFTKNTVTKMVSDAEKRLSNVKIMLNEKNTTLQKLIKQPDSTENTSKIIKITQEIVELRKELKDARAEYYRLLFLIHG